MTTTIEIDFDALRRRRWWTLAEAAAHLGVVVETAVKLLSPIDPRSGGRGRPKYERARILALYRKLTVGAKLETLPLRYLRPDEAADYMRNSVRKLNDMRLRDEVPYLALSRQSYRYDPRELDKVLRKGR